MRESNNGLRWRGSKILADNGYVKSSTQYRKINEYSFLEEFEALVVGVLADPSLLPRVQCGIVSSADFFTKKSTKRYSGSSETSLLTILTLLRSKKDFQIHDHKRYFRQLIRAAILSSPLYPTFCSTQETVRISQATGWDRP